MKLEKLRLVSLSGLDAQLKIGIDWSFGGKNGNSAKAVRAEIFSIRNGGVEMIVGQVKPMGWVLFSGRRRPKHGYLRAETDISIIQ